MRPDAQPAEEVAREAVRAALIAAGWLLRPAAPNPRMVRVWDARFEPPDDALVVEMTDRSRYTIHLTPRPPGASSSA